MGLFDSKKKESEISRLQQELFHSQTQAKSLQQQITHIRTQAAQSIANIQNTEITRLRANLEDLKDERRTLQVDLQFSRDGERSAGRKLEELVGNVSVSDERVKRLQGILARSNGDAAVMAGGGSQVADLREIIKAQGYEIRKLEGEIKEKDSTVVVGLRRAAELRASCKEATDVTQTLNKELDVEREKNREYSRELRSKQEELEGIRNALNQYSAQVQEEKRKALLNRQELLKAERSIVELQGTRTALEKAQKDMKDMENDKARLCEALKSFAEEAKHKEAKHKSEMETLHNDMKVKESEYKSNLDELEALCRLAVKKLREEMNAMESEHELKLSSLAREMSDQLRESKDLLSQRDRVVNELGAAVNLKEIANVELQRQLHEMTEELQRSTEELQKKANDFQELTESNEQTRMTLNRTRVDLNSKTSKAQRACQEMDTLGRQFEFVQQQCAALQKKVTAASRKGPSEDRYDTISSRIIESSKKSTQKPKLKKSRSETSDLRNITSQHERRTSSNGKQERFSLTERLGPLREREAGEEEFRFRRRMQRASSSMLLDIG